MSLHRIKTLYCIAVISIAVILDCVGGLLGWTAAVVLLAGALPLFGIVCQAAEIKGAQSALIRIRQRVMADMGSTDDSPQ